MPFAQDFTPLERDNAQPLPEADAIQVTLRALLLTAKGPSPAPPLLSLEDIDQLLWTTRVLMAHGRYREAAPLAEAAVARAPERFEVWLCKAVIHEYLSDGAAALEAADRAVALQPEHALALTCRAGGLVLLERPAEAVTAAKAALAIDPANYAARNNIGVALAHLKRTADALVAYDHALALDPRDAMVLANKSVELRNLQRYDEALAATDQALALDPQSALIWTRRGNTLGAFTDVMTLWRRLLRLPCWIRRTHSGGTRWASC